MKINGVERIQHMWMRVSIGIHGNDLKRVKETYDLMSQKYFTHATPTLFNAGTPKPQLSSCFLQTMESDSVDGIYNTLKIVQIFLNGLVESDFIFIMFVQQVHISVELMENLTVLFLC